MPTFNVELDDETVAKLTLVAQEQGATLEQVIRHCILKGYDYCFGEFRNQLDKFGHQMAEIRQTVDAAQSNLSPKLQAMLAERRARKEQQSAPSDPNPSANE